MGRNHETTQARAGIEIREFDQSRVHNVRDLRYRHGRLGHVGGKYEPTTITTIIIIAMMMTTTTTITIVAMTTTKFPSLNAGSFSCADGLSWKCPIVNTRGKSSLLEIHFDPSSSTRWASTSPVRRSTTPSVIPSSMSDGCGKAKACCC